MFYFSYIASELRRRKGRTILTALGLAVGVGLVVAVSATSAGLDDAQDEVLKPLTGVGTDISVTRPINVEGGLENLSKQERKQLEKENGGGRVRLNNRGEPGEKFSSTDFLATQRRCSWHFFLWEVNKKKSYPYTHCCPKPPGYLSGHYYHKIALPCQHNSCPRLCQSMQRWKIL